MATIPLSERDARRRRTRANERVGSRALICELAPVIQEAVDRCVSELSCASLELHAHHANYITIGIIDAVEKCFQQSFDKLK